MSTPPSFTLLPLARAEEVCKDLNQDAEHRELFTYDQSTVTNKAGNTLYFVRLYVDGNLEHTL